MRGVFIRKSFGRNEGRVEDRDVVAFATSNRLRARPLVAAAVHPVQITGVEPRAACAGRRARRWSVVSSVESSKHLISSRSRG
jgi:hypothetical protein